MDILKELVSWAKANAKDGVNIAEFEELVSKAQPPDDSVQAFEWMKKIPSLRSALDAALNREFDRAVKKYEEEKLPEKEKAMRESIRKELNPDETPEQKENRELREQNEAMKRKELLREQKELLMGKGKEVGIDPLIAADYAVFGEQADEIMKRHATHWKSQIDAVKAETARATYGNKTPKDGSEVKPPSLEEEYKKRSASGDREGANLLYVQAMRSKVEVK